MLRTIARFLLPPRRSARPTPARARRTHLAVEELERRDCPSSAGDWAMFNADPSGSRVNPSETLLSPFDVAHFGLSVRWRFDTPGSVSGTPAVVGGVVYDGDLGGNFYALRDDSWGPVVLWHTKVSSGITDSPLVLSLPDGRSEVIFGDQTGNIYGLDAATGAVDWKVHPNNTSSAIAIYSSATPIQVGGTTYVAVGIASNEEDAPPSPTHPRFTTRGSVVLLDPSDGRVVWQTYTVTDAESAAGASGAGVWATPTFDAATGTIYVTTGNNYSTPATPTSDAVLALDAATGRILWATQATPGDTFNGSIGASPSTPDFDFGDSPQVYTLPGGARVVGAGQKSGVYYVLDAASGRVLHATALEPGGDLGGLFADSAVDQRAGLVLANGTDWPNPDTTLPTRGDLFALSLDGTRTVWDFQTPLSPNITGVAVAGGVVYLQSLNDGRLYALDEHTGALLDAVQTAGSSSGPAISNGRLYEGTGYAFGKLVIQSRISGGIVAVGLGPPRPGVELKTLLAEEVNQTNVVQSLAPQTQLPNRAVSVAIARLVLAKTVVQQFPTILGGVSHSLSVDLAGLFRSPILLLAEVKRAERTLTALVSVIAAPPPPPAPHPILRLETTAVLVSATGPVGHSLLVRGLRASPHPLLASHLRRLAGLLW